jgi:hypothetical protein
MTLYLIIEKQNNSDIELEEIKKEINFADVC